MTDEKITMQNPPKGSRSVPRRAPRPAPKANPTAHQEPPKVLVVDGNTKEYKAGEKITYETVRILCNGQDVTSMCSFSPTPGTPWDRAAKSTTATATYSSRDGSSSVSFELRKKKGKRVLIAVLASVAVVATVIAVLLLNPDILKNLFGDKEDHTGAYLIPQGNMSDEEAQALVDDMAEKSRITVDLASKMMLKDGQIRVNFKVPEGNNGLSERLEVEQGGVVIAKTDVLQPGYMVEWIDVDDKAQVGPATATVYAVSGGSDTGNPISVEIPVVGPDSVAQPTE